MSSFGPGGYGPPPYRSLGRFGSRFGDYGGYPDNTDFGGGFRCAFSGYRGESSFGYPSRFGSYGEGLGGVYDGSGLGAYGHEVRGYGGYDGSGSGDGYDSGPATTYGGPRGMYGSRAGYGGSSHYHPYGR